MTPARSPSSVPPVIVASHERSGTHFLINTLASNFGFAPHPVECDIRSGADFYVAANFRAYLECIIHAGRGRLVKTHHHVAFFETFFEELRDQFVIFYVYRNPADVMCSFWRYVHKAARREGPLAATPGDFMRAAPSWGMLRYQAQQHVSVLERWRAHVDAWTTTGVERAGVVPVAYEDLNLRFEATVDRLAQRLGLPCPERPVRPPVDRNVMLPGPGRVGGFRGQLDTDDLVLIREIGGETLKRLDLDRWLEGEGTPPAETWAARS